MGDPPTTRRRSLTWPSSSPSATATLASAPRSRSRCCPSTCSRWLTCCDRLCACDRSPARLDVVPGIDGRLRDPSYVLDAGGFSENRQAANDCWQSLVARKLHG